MCIDSIVSLSSPRSTLVLVKALHGQSVILAKLSGEVWRLPPLPRRGFLRLVAEQHPNQITVSDPRCTLSYLLAGSKHRYGVFGVADTGVPSQRQDYVTLVLIHGYLWHSGNFIRLLPLAEKHGIRIVLLNRRDYPGATPLSDEELIPYRTAATSQDPGAALESLRTSAVARARELHEFLQTFIVDEEIPQKGGVVIGGWSLGGTLVTSFLTYAATFPQDRVNLTSYIRCFILYNTPSRLLGYKPPKEKRQLYNPLDDESLTPLERLRVFNRWVSGYYSHGSSVATFVDREWLETPPPTFDGMSADEFAASVDMSPARPGGSDVIWTDFGIKTGLFSELREKTLFPRADPDDQWSKIELKTLLCDAGPWEMTWGRWKMAEELEEGQKASKYMRPVKLLTLKGANSFAQWDDPEGLLRTMLDLKTD